MSKNYRIGPWLFTTLLALCLIAFQSGYGQNLAKWSTTSATGTEDSLAGTAASNATARYLKRSKGLLKQNGAVGYFVANGWKSTLDTTLYFQFEVDANSGYTITTDSLYFTTYRSGTGTPSFEVKTSSDGFNSSIFTGTIAGSNGANKLQFPTTGFTGLSKLIVRIYGYGATGTGGTFRLADVHISGTANLATTQTTTTAPNLINLGNVVTGVAKTGSFQFSGTNWTDSASIITKDSIRISLSPTGPFVKSILFPLGGNYSNKTVYYSYLGTQIGPFIDSIALFSGLPTVSNPIPVIKFITVSGTVITAPASIITTSTQSINYGTVNTSSVNDVTLTVSGTNLNGNLVITAPAGVQISTTPAPGFVSGSPITLNATGGVVASTSIYVRYAPTVAGILSDTLLLVSGTTKVKVALSGTAVVPVVATSLVFWNTTTAIPSSATTDSLAATTVGTNITAGKLKHGPTLTATNIAKFLNASGWPTSTTADLGKYYEFSLTANSGFQINLDSTVFYIGNNGSGPSSYEIRSSLDGFVAVLGSGSVAAAKKYKILLPGLFSGINGTLKFRIYGFNSGTGTFRIGDVRIWGSVNPTTTQTTITTPSAVNLGNVVTGVAKTGSFQFSGTNWPAGSYILTKAPFGILGISLSASGPFTDSVKFANGGNFTSQTVYYSYTSTTLGAFTDSLEFVADTVYQKIPVTGTVTTAPASLITTSTQAINYGTVNTGSVTDSVLTVSGTFLTGNLVITAPAGVQISTTPAPGFVSASPITLTAISGTVGATKIYVRYAPTANGTLNDSIALVAGSNTVKVSVKGNAITPVVPIGLAVWNTTSAIPNSVKTDSLAATIVATNVTAGKLKHGPGITAAALTGFLNSTGWAQGTTYDSTLYYQYSLSANNGYSLNLDKVTLSLYRSNAGAKNYEIRSSLDGYTSVLASGSSPTTATPVTVQLNSTFTGLTSPVNFRVYGFNSGNGNFRIGNVTVWGTVNPTATQTTITSPDSLNLGNVITGVAKTGSFQFSGTNWTDSALIVTKDSIKISLSPTGPFTNILRFTQGGNFTNQTVYYSYTSTRLGAFIDSIAILGDTTPVVKFITVKGTVIPAPASIITASPLSIDFGTVNIGSVTDSILTVSASNLTSNLVITAPAGVQISKTPAPGFVSGSPITLSATAGTIASTKIYVRYAPTSAGTLLDSISLVSGSTTLKVQVLGNAIVPIPSTGLAVWNTVSGITQSVKTDSFATTSTDPNVTGGYLRHGPGITANPIAKYLNSNGWPSAATVDTSKYYEFSLIANSGYQLNMDSVEFILSRNPSGPTKYQISSSVDGYVGIIGSGTVTATATSYKFALSRTAYSRLTNTVNFRVYGFKASGGTFRIGNVSVLGNAVIVGTEKPIGTEVGLYPNPAESWFKVYAGKKAEITLYDALGKLVISTSVSDTETRTISTENMAKGIYMVNIKTASGSTTKRLVVQ